MKSIELLHDVQIQTTHWWNKAKEIYGEDRLEGAPFVNFNIRGKVAGKVDIITHEIKYNKILLEENYDAFCSRTIPHEVAHIVAFQLYGSRGHDKYWKKVMIESKNAICGCTCLSQDSMMLLRMLWLLRSCGQPHMAHNDVFYSALVSQCYGNL